MGSLTIRAIERFATKFEIQENGCWGWKKIYSTDKYGRFSVATSQSKLAHRVIYELINGPTELHIDHLCRNTRCVNPSHLEAVSQRTNNRRQADIITHCPKGHPYSSHNLIVRKGAYGLERKCRQCDRAWSRKSYLRRKLNGESQRETAHQR